jgi:DNA-directed RNA polymerase specialized sigma24 family protein
MTSRPTPDVRLVERMAAGDRDAHEEFCERHRLSLYAQAYAVLFDAALAERVVVETLERVWQAARDFNPGAGSAFAWVSEIARSLASRRRRPPQGPPASRSLAR